MKNKYLRGLRCFEVLVGRKKYFCVAENVDKAMKLTEEGGNVLFEEDNLKMVELPDSIAFLDEESELCMRVGKGKRKKNALFPVSVWSDLVHIEERWAQGIAKLDEMCPSDFRYEDINEMAKKLFVLPSEINDMLSLSDWGECDECNIVCNTLSEVRYAGTDFFFNNEKENKEKDGFCICDDCLDESKITFI